jgi:hypothetical protein
VVRGADVKFLKRMGPRCQDDHVGFDCRSIRVRYVRGGYVGWCDGCLDGVLTVLSGTFDGVLTVLSGVFYGLLTVL